VIKWKVPETPAVFATKIYSESFAGAGESSVVSLANALIPNPVTGLSRLCTEISPLFIEDTTGTNRYGDNSTTYAAGGFGQYWWPSNCSGFFYPSLTLSGRFTGPVAMFHSVEVLKKTMTQSITIDTNQISNSKKVLALFIEALNPNSTPIINYAGEDVQVELYSYHPNQVPQLSFYKPIMTFNIRGAQSTSSNPLARYWHILNFVYNETTGTYEPQLVREPLSPDTIHQNGSIETSFQEILDNVEIEEML
jgi:hypothetical protein